MLDVGKLPTLRAVLARGSFSAAAASLNLTQPAVSRQVSLLERQVGTQLVRRTQRGVLPTEAGQLLVEHAEAVLARLALAEAQVADLAGLRSGHVRLGSFFTALVYLSAELAGVLEARHPDLFRLQHDVIEDQLVDRATAFRRLAAGELDVAVVFEHAFDPSPPPRDIELIPLFDDPPRALIPAGHALALATSLAPADLADDTWIRAHRGSAARSGRPRAHPRAARAADPARRPRRRTDRGAGVHRGRPRHHRRPSPQRHPRPAQIAAVPLRGAPVRHIQAAIVREQRAPAALAVVDALHEIGRRRSGTACDQLDGVG